MSFINFVYDCYMKDSNATPLGHLTDYMAKNWKKIKNLARYEILNKLSTFNVTISCDNYIPVKLSAICVYDKNTTEVFTKTISIKDKTTISLEEFQKAFVYNPKYGKTPIQIDFIVYPYNKKSYKWTIMYS